MAGGASDRRGSSRASDRRIFRSPDRIATSRGARLRAGAPRAFLRRRAGARAGGLGRVPGGLPARDVRARGALQPGALPRAPGQVRVRRGGAASVRGRPTWRLPQHGGLHAAALAGGARRARRSGSRAATRRTEHARPRPVLTSARDARRALSPPRRARGHGSRRRARCRRPGRARCRCASRAAAMNHIDLWLRQGLPALPVAFPHVAGRRRVRRRLGAGRRACARCRTRRRAIASLVNPGLSCGRCAACLAGRDNFCPDCKMLGEQTQGGQAEYVVVPAANLVPAPRARVPLDDAQLAAIPTVFMTAWQMLVDRARDPAGRDRAGDRRRLRRRHGGDPDREAVGRARDRDRVDRREAGRGARARAPTTPSTTRPPTSSPR